MARSRRPSLDTATLHIIIKQYNVKFTVIRSLHTIILPEMIRTLGIHIFRIFSALYAKCPYFLLLYMHAKCAFCSSIRETPAICHATGVWHDVVTPDPSAGMVKRAL